MKKIVLLTAALFFISAGISVYAENALQEESEKDLANAIVLANKEMSESYENLIVSKIIGKWSDRNNECETQIQLLNTGLMQILQRTKKQHVIYRGTYKISPELIIFHIKSVETKKGPAKRKTSSDEVWSINFYPIDENNIKVNFLLQPEDFINKQFSSETLFTRIGK